MLHNLLNNLLISLKLYCTTSFMMSLMRTRPHAVALGLAGLLAGRGSACDPCDATSCSADLPSPLLWASVRTLVSARPSSSFAAITSTPTTMIITRTTSTMPPITARVHVVSFFRGPSLSSPYTLHSSLESSSVHARARRWKWNIAIAPSWREEEKI